MTRRAWFRLVFGVVVAGPLVPKLSTRPFQFTPRYYSMRIEYREVLPVCPSIAELNRITFEQMAPPIQAAFFAVTPIMTALRRRE